MSNFRYLSTNTMIEVSGVIKRSKTEFVDSKGIFGRPLKKKMTIEYDEPFKKEVKAESPDVYVNIYQIECIEFDTISIAEYLEFYVTMDCDKIDQSENLHVLKVYTTSDSYSLFFGSREAMFSFAMEKFDMKLFDLEKDHAV